MQICSNCGEENPDRFRLCGFCGTKLAADLPPQESRKTVTVVFTDLQGSTTLAERLDTETLREILRLYFNGMQSVIERHGGTIEKFIGDAIVAVFGFPRVHEDDALRAVRAAVEMQDALAEVNEDLDARWGIRLANRTGVNTGEVVAGDVTSGQRLLSGDTVNTAARLEQAAPENQILIGAGTYLLVQDSVEAEPVPPLELKGKSEPVPAYLLTAVKESPDTITRHLDTPLVGRAHELSRLAESWHRTLEEQGCRLVTIVADAGVGKSRLLRQFAASVAGSATVILARCVSYGEGVTFLPLIEAIRGATGILREDSPDAARAKLSALAANQEVFERAAAVIGLSAETYPIEETFWAARKLFETAARRGGLVLVLEDLHWAEPTFLDLVEHLVVESRGVPILIACSTRQDLLEQRPDWSTESAERLFLQPLTPKESARVIANIVGATPLPQELEERIVAASEGNPLFVEQMVSMLLDVGALTRGPEGGWIVSKEPGALTVPPTIAALLSARLDSLASDDRAVVERGSVVGQLFYRGAVEALSPPPLLPSIPRSLASLTRKQLIRSAQSDLTDQEAHRFAHALVRDAAYHGLLKRVRVEYHEAVANWLERTATSLVEFEEVVGYQLEQAYRIRSELGALDDHGRELGRRAAQRLGTAGRRAFSRGDMPSALNLLDRAISVVEANDPIRLELSPDLAEALDALGEFDRAEAVLDEAIRQASRVDNPAVEMEASVVRALVRITAGRAGDALDVADRAIPILRAASHCRGLARAWRLVAFVHGTAGRYGAAQAALDAVIENARWAGDHRLERASLANYGWCAVYGPMPVPEAVTRCSQLLRAATGDRRSESLLRCALGQLRAMEGGFGDARALVAEARATLDDLGERVLASSRSLDGARIELLAGDLAAAEAQLRRDYEVLDRMGERYYLSGVASLLAYSLLLQGRLEEAEPLTLVSERWGEEDAEDQALWRRARARIRAAQGRLEESFALIRGALELVATTDSPVLRANTVLDHARILAASGQREEATQQAGLALDLFVQKGHVLATRWAEALLSELGQAPTEAVRRPPTIAPGTANQEPVTAPTS